MPRLFVAIEIPNQIKKDLARFPRELPIARWVPENQLHLTLRFIGEVGPREFGAIKAALSKLTFPRFSLQLRGMGHFPPGRHPRVLWVGMEANEILNQLYGAVELSLTDAGIPPEDRPFSPHLTLARLKDTPPGRVLAFEEKYQSISYPPFEVCEAILFSSVLGKEGAVHTRELVVPCLAGSH